MTPYRLNRPAVVQHEKNLRVQIVQEILSAIGIERVHDLARRAPPLLHWYAEANKIEPTPEQVPATVIEVRLNDLVDRRNQVTHNGGDVADVLGVDEMSDVLQFIEAYAHALFDVVAAVYLERRYVKSGEAATNLGQSVEGPFMGGAVVVVQKPACDLIPGQTLLGVTAGRVDRWGTIEELQIDGVTVERVEATSAAETIGIRLTFKASKATRMYALHARDDLVWGD